MIFTESANLRALERMMKRVPHFQPRRQGIVITQTPKLTAEDCSCENCPEFAGGVCTLRHCPCIQERIDAGAASTKEILSEALTGYTDTRFRKRLKKLIKESEDTNMVFRSELHEKLFREAIEKKDRKNYKLMAALFLLTANVRLWNYAHLYVRGNSIDFDKMTLKGMTELGYTMYCAAKDLYTGSRHFTVSDLADSDLISPMQFSLIVFAMAIRRFGLGAVHMQDGE